MTFSAASSASSFPKEADRDLDILPSLNEESWIISNA